MEISKTKKTVINNLKDVNKQRILQGVTSEQTSEAMHKNFKGTAKICYVGDKCLSWREIESHDCCIQFNNINIIERFLHHIFVMNYCVLFNQNNENTTSFEKLLKYEKRYSF